MATKSPFHNSLLGWQELRHKDTPLTHTAPSLAPRRPSGLAPRGSFFPGTWCQNHSCPQLRMGSEKWASGVLDLITPSLHCRGHTGQGAPPAGRWSGTSQDHPGSEISSTLCTLEAWESGGPAFCPGPRFPSQLRWSMREQMLQCLASILAQHVCFSVVWFLLLF